MLYGNLENQMHFLIEETGKTPQVIIMNQASWYDLKSYLYEHSHANFFTDKIERLYRGIKVIISDDVESGKFLIY